MSETLPGGVEIPEGIQAAAPAPEQPAAPVSAPKTASAKSPAAPIKTQAPPPEAPAPKTKRVMFLSGSDAAGSQPFDVAVNDEHGTKRFYTFGRDMPVDVPLHVLEVINNAVMTVYERHGNVNVPKQVRRFPYQTL